jgi:hypothetical protein
VVEAPTYARTAIDASSSAALLGSGLAAGDHDGDGAADLAAGAPGEGTGRGALAVFFAADGLGSTDLAQADAGFLVFGDESGDGLGGAVRFGELDGDGYADLVSCAPGDDTAGSFAGACWVFRGAPSRVVTDADARANADVTIYGGAGDELGTRAPAVALGDADGDGTDELALVTVAGAVRVYTAVATTVALDAADARWTTTGDTVHLADLTRDGRAELLVGAPGLDAGAVTLIDLALPGTLALPVAQSASWSGEVLGDGLGAALTVGDLDGDARPDLALAAPTHDGPASATGKVYVLPGY